MHINTHLKKESVGKTGLGVYPDGMVEHDGHVGELLAKLDQLGIADNTIVMYSTDNDAEKCSWPDGGTSPFRGEKATNWEGGWRVPCAIRWPGVIKPGTVSNEIFSHQDMLPTLLAAAGEPDIVEKCKKGYKAGPEVVNFGQLQGGDPVKAIVTEEVAVFIGSGAPPSRDASSGVALAPVGAKPGGVFVDIQQITVKITAVDATKNKVTFQRPDGTTQTVKIGKNVDISSLRPGDNVTVVVTEGLVITVAKP